MVVRSLAFPNHKATPPRRLERGLRSLVAFDVAGKLRKPITEAALWLARKLATRMLMPKAAMHLNDLSVAREHEVRSSRKVLPVKPEAEAQGVHGSSNDQFRLGVPLANAPHVGAALCRS